MKTCVTVTADSFHSCTNYIDTYNTFKALIYSLKLTNLKEFQGPVGALNVKKNAPTVCAFCLLLNTNKLCILHESHL